MNLLLRTALVFAAALIAAAPLQAQVSHQHQGRWLGDIHLPDGTTDSFGIEFLRRADGSFWASGASPARGAFHLPVTAFTETGNEVVMRFPFAVVKLRWDGGQFSGAFHQNGEAMPLTLHKVDTFAVQLRPQTPRPPFPYRQETMAIGSAPGVALGATLSTPAGADKVNAVVLVHGSGPQTRDEQFAGHQRAAVIADYLARRGIAVLRYDKRGIAYSSGDYENHTVADLSTDLHAVLKALRARGQFARIGVVASSEGPEVAAAVAAHHPDDIDFIVSLAGTGLNGLEAMMVQDRAYAQDHKASPEEVERLMVYVRQFYTTIIAQEDTAARLTALKALRARQTSADEALIAKYEMDQGTLSLDWAAKPFLRASLRSDPPADWRAVRCPVLALNGSVDRQVPPTENLGGLAAALAAGGNTKVESAVLPGLNHLFQTSATGAEDEYDRIAETIAPAALERVAGFIGRQR